ncbi:hypothetical protein NI462_03680 [Acinetobacter lwoffii]|uniref:hypothetical protein n=1 Tax=Acinetobacter lwoffii TaxID=28090 RepID=UPI00209B3A62|nr:hypothetical protein [Acinetobacter lwoffii]MCO8096290.1 hypothetical protein [Acinetobacter lwoffii]
MLYQKMIGWTVPACRDADQQKMLPLNNLAQFIARLEGNEPVWISVATAAPLQAKIDAFKKAVFADGMHQRLRHRAANIVDIGFIYSS